MIKRNKVLFLYTEIAEYFLACIRELHKDADVAIVRWPLNPEAPFQFSFDPGWTILDRSMTDEQNLKEFVDAFDPDIIVCSGWMDKLYVKTAKRWFGRVPTVLSLDNHYTGSFKQIILTWASPFTLKRWFSHVWVPGEPQYRYARKLGFNPGQIIDGFYSADVDHFDRIYGNTFPAKEKHFPHRFIFIGRYLGFKGIYELWDAFISALEKSGKTDWELWCLGTGDEWDSRKEHPKIRHSGFVQPGEMESILKETGVFVLPSRKEPWGVVVHEMAVAGFPMLLSDAVGAASRFLSEGENGYAFPAGDQEALTNRMITMMGKSDEELIAMGRASHRAGMELNPEIWKQTLLGLLTHIE